MAKIKLDTKEIERFIKRVDRKANTQLKNEVVTWLDASGMQFLDEVQRQIKSMGVVDTRRLLTSFDKGGDGNVWKIKSGGLELEIGTNVKYAAAVNDGYDQEARFVPGYWSGDRFTYDPKADTGMMLTERHVEGRPYWDNAVIIFEKMFKLSFEKRLKQWAKKVRW